MTAEAKETLEETVKDTSTIKPAPPVQKKRKTPRKFVNRKPKGKPLNPVVRVGVDYPEDKYTVIAKAVSQGMIPSIASIIRNALEDTYNAFKDKVA